MIPRSRPEQRLDFFIVCSLLEKCNFKCTQTLPSRDEALFFCSIPHQPCSNRLHHRPPNGPPGPPKIPNLSTITTFGLVPYLTAHFATSSSAILRHMTLTS